MHISFLRDRRICMYPFCVLREYAQILLAYSYFFLIRGKDISVFSIYAEKYMHVRRICLYPFCVIEEYAHILSVYMENTHKSFPRIHIFSLYAERIYAYSPYTQKGYKQILLIHGKDICVFSDTQKGYKRILQIRR